MVIFKSASALGDFLGKQDQNEAKVGFIPTMGALHEGHISLINRARQDGMLAVCSIFLNPTQFNDRSDYEKYPVSTDKDILMLVKAECDVLFLPSVEEIYPGGPGETESYSFGYLDNILEGATRPGHFRGVGQVVGRLLAIVKPNRIYLGQKDYQQCLVIGQLLEILKLDDLNLSICPTLREADGLAMSSRNRRLTDPQRAIAGSIYQCLVSIQAKKGTTSFSIVKKECTDLLEHKGFQIDYVALATSGDLTLLDDYQDDIEMIALIAVKIGGIRLIDNILL